MLTLNLTDLSSTSTVIFSKSKHQYPINVSSLLNPNLLNRTHPQRCLHHLSALPSKPISLVTQLGTKVSSLSKSHGHPLGLSSQIQDSGPKIGHLSRISAYPSGFSSKPRSQIPEQHQRPILMVKVLYLSPRAIPRPSGLHLCLVYGTSRTLSSTSTIRNSNRAQRFRKPFIIALLGPALFHTIGHISACVSFSKVAVSFTHVIKSSEPVFSVVFSSFLGDTYPLQVWLSILPIVLGCSLAAVTEVSFNYQGLWGALISNVGFVLRNIYSKRSLQSFKEVDGLNLYGWISIISLLYLFPVAVFVEGSQWVQGYHRAIQAVGKPSTLYIWVLLSGVFYHLYNQSSYQALDEISPLTFSVGNTMKRVVVIVSTVLVFRNPVRPLNALGSAIAIFGTFLYSQATPASKKKVAEKKD
ncbi:hypothetical protein SLA2020_272790 [Shorea laevis]